MHRLSEFQHDVVCQVGKEVDGAGTAIVEADAHIDGRNFTADIFHPDGGIAIYEVGRTHFDTEGRERVIRRKVGGGDGAERPARDGGEFPRDAVMSPQVGTVGQRLVVHLEDDVVKIVDALDVGAECDVIGNLEKSRVIVAHAELGFGTAHTVGLVTRDGRDLDLMSRDTAADGGEGDFHADADVRCAADDVEEFFSRVDLQQVEFFRVGVIFDRGDLGDDDAVGVLPFDIDVFDLGGGERKVADQCLSVKPREVDEISDPVHG